MEEVIGDVGGKKERGEQRGGKHEAHVDDAALAADVEIAADEADGAEGVEGCVRGGE